jgi:hypothetical protein
MCRERLRLIQRGLLYTVHDGASIVGVTVPALEAMTLLLDTLSEVKDGPKATTRLSDDVQAVDATLNLLRGVGDRYCTIR